MPINRLRSTSLAAISTALAGLAIAAGTVHADPGVTLASRDAGPTVIATVEDGRRTIEFVREVSGGLGVAELTPAGTPSLLAGALSDLTPDEMYERLVAPGGQTPSKLGLATDAPVPTPPAGLSAPTMKGAPAPQALVPVAEDYCAYDIFPQPGNSDFASDWYWDFGQYRDRSEQETYEQIALDGVQPDGAVGDVWMLGPSTQRWLGVCNGSDQTPNEVFFFAESRNYLGEWVTTYTANVPSGYQLVYTSFSPGNPDWRIRLAPLSFNVGPQEDLSVVAAWNEPIDTITWQLPEDDGEGPGPEGDAPQGDGRTGLAGTRSR